MSKKGRPTDEEILAQFDTIGVEDPAKGGSKPGAGDQDPDALLEELGIAERPKSSSRPHTPRTHTGSTSKSSPKVTRTVTPTSTDGARSSEEKVHVRKSGESSRSFHNSFTPASSGEGEPEPEKSASIVPEAIQAQSSGGGWWGSVFSTASAAVKQAEALAKEIRHNEEAQRWADQVKGNVGALRGFGTLQSAPEIQRFVLTATQVVNFALVPFQPLQISFIPSRHPFPLTSVYRSTSPMILLATLPSILSSTPPSPALWLRSKVVT